MSKKANKKNQEKLKVYLSKNDIKSNRSTDNKLRNEPSADKHRLLR